ncbi:MAG: 4Fe-4S binding protein [Bacillota bacterium]
MGIKEKISPKQFILPIVFFVIFLGIALSTWLSTGYIFYLFNFGYIGFSICFAMVLDIVLPRKHKPWGRRVSQLLVGCYMLIFLGVFGRENMQIEGFFMYVLLGLFAAAAMHYVIAKIVGPLVFGRAWCGYACWTAMILDLLPYKIPKGGRLRYYGLLRYLHFFLSLGLILIIWFIFERRPVYQSVEELYWLTAGNLIYYAVGIALAFKLQDNRAFCKYACPIPVLQKIGSRFSLMKVKINKDKCNFCGVCEKVCPMNVKLLDYKELDKRVLSTECIICSTCINSCPKRAISITFGLDAGLAERLDFVDRGSTIINPTFKG